MSEEILIRVAANSSPSQVAGAIAGQLRQQRHVRVQAIGPAAVNQMVKAIAVARRYLQDDRLSLLFVPSFVDVTIDEHTRTALRLQVYAETDAEG